MKKVICYLLIRRFLSGNVVNWNTATWHLQHLIQDSKSKDEVCLLPKKRHIVFPELRPYHATKLLCQKVGGKITVVMDKEMQRQLIRTFKKTLAEKYYDMGM